MEPSTVSVSASRRLPKGSFFAVNAALVSVPRVSLWDKVRVPQYVSLKTEPSVAFRRPQLLCVQEVW